MVTSKQLRAQAREVGDSIHDLTATSNRIGEADGWTGERYAAIQRDLAKWRVERAALIARAVALETAAA